MARSRPVQGLNGQARLETVLAALIDDLGHGVERLGEDFARGLAAQLHATADHITLPEVDALGLSDVVVTLYMDTTMRLVVTGHLNETRGEASLRWREEDFSRVPVVIHEKTRPEPYLFATLDFSVRGRRAILTRDVLPGRAGQEVSLRCLATLGDDLHYRIRLEGTELSVDPRALHIIETT